MQTWENSMKSSLFLMVCTVACLLTGVFDVRAEPQPGEVWREYRVALGADGMFRIGGEFGGSQNLDVNYPLAPYRMKLTEPQAPSYELDLVHATKAELMVGYNQSHSGAPVIYVSLNNNPYQLLPRPASILNSGYFFHIFPTISVPLTHLQTTSNVYKFANDKWLKNPTNYVAGYDQSLLYEMVLRVYYDPALKPHPTGAITAPVAGATISGDNAARPTLTASATNSDGGAGNVLVDFIGFYDDFDRTGDTQYRRWHYRWKHYNANTYLSFIDHIGSDSVAPYQVTWNMDWIPNQTLPLKLAAFVTGSDGVMTMLTPVENITFTRADRFVELAKPTLTPPNFKTSSSKLSDRQAKFQVNGISNSLRQATTARQMYQFWPGGGNDNMGLVFNATNHHPTFYPNESFPAEYLKTGVNDIEVDKGGEHGMEVHWPGVGVYIAYDTRPAPSVIRQPQNVAVLPGESALFTARFSGTPEPGYQWQVLPKNQTVWSDLAGAVQPALSLTNLATSADGMRYRILATNNSGSVTSSVVTLRVAPILPSFQMADGTVSMEAENCDRNSLNGETYGWMVMDDITGYSGSAYLWNYYHNTTISAWGTAATVSYRFRAATNGNYIAWLRVRNKQVDQNHSLIVGYDGLEHKSLYTDKTTTSWIWITAPVKALSAGEHTFDVMRRSDGLFVDKVVITSNTNLIPSTISNGYGPVESARDIFLSNTTQIVFPTVNTTVRAGDALSLLGNGANLRWTVSGAVSATGTGASFDIIVPENAAEGSQLSILLEGDAGSDSISLPVVTPPRAFQERNGLVVFEAEDFFSSNTRGDSSAWSARTDTNGYAGTGYVTISDEQTISKTWDVGALLTYDVRIDTPGDYSLWMRILAGDGDANSAFFSQANIAPSSHFDNSVTTGWNWKKGPQTFTVTTPGTYTFWLVNREDGYSVDRIILSTNAVYNPSAVNGGLGPDASGRYGDSALKNYASWRSSHSWTNGADDSLSGDPDGDGAANAWEFFLGNSPVDSSSVPAIFRADRVFINGRLHAYCQINFDPDTDQTLYARATTNLTTGWAERFAIHPADSTPLPEWASIEQIDGTTNRTVNLKMDLTGREKFYFRLELETR
jgi:hypothetical protein